MRSKLQQFGLIALGVCLGVMISLNFSAVAQREVLGPLPVEELRAFTEVFGRIKSDYVETVEDKKLITEAITGMLAGLDPHSAYLDQDAFRELQVGTQGEFGGLGIEVGMEDGFVKVVSPIDDSPASRAGIKSGDLIVKLDDTAVKGMTLNDAVKRMRGKPNTQITLTIVRKGETKPIVATLTRAVIKIQSVKSKLLEPGYAYFRVTQFQEHTGETLAAAIQNLYKQNQGAMRGIVLDLRNDPGGLLNGAVAVSAAFLPQNTLVVYTDGRTEDAKMRLTAIPENYLRVLRRAPSSSLRMTGNSRQGIRGIFLRKFRCVGIYGSGFKQNPRIPPPHDLGHAGEIILSFNRAHAVTAVIVPIRNAIAETNHRCHDVRGGDVRNVETLHYSRGIWKMQCVSQRLHVRHRINGAG